MVLAKWGDSNTNNTRPVPADGVTNNTDVLKEPLGDDSSQTGLFLGSYAALGFGQVHKTLSLHSIMNSVSIGFAFFPI